jgi:hypothetical protein
MKIGKMLAVGGAALVLFGMGVGVGSAQPYEGHMQAAIDRLLAARDELYAARPNKGGHREAAIDLIDRSIHEVRLGIQYGEYN